MPNSSLTRQCLHGAHLIAMVGYWAVGIGLGMFLMQYLFSHVYVISTHVAWDPLRMVLQVAGELLCILGAIAIAAAFIAFEFKCDRYVCHKNRNIAE